MSIYTQSAIIWTNGKTGANHIIYSRCKRTKAVDYSVNGKHCRRKDEGTGLLEDVIKELRIYGGL